ncbi:B12-binding domain-containing radical SAM protein [Candidatus Magnetominusculus xianensis]|uniref:B12-binding domain-containing radical SAM protein n=1 Tax=Candidatus Magnetominusculus xianensis TaxID=1748249 RepID=A0ABR5SDI4_9BACT|nr:radical SAM protein [Candidatus Magnetominusculus xianensis]KWT78362.1 B12-binding domain-containing radical SAM protein [Candidatus Magnetominusculus xianensis]MBF0402900.1 B12-binding domain-containing radical SAM protein [Nitrospirota bacterium]
MKILFIIENGLQESLGVASIIAYISRTGGHTADVVLYSHVKDIFDYIKTTKPDIIGFSIVTGSHRFAYSLGKKIRSESVIPTIAGGPHATYYPEHMAESGAFDYICRGEGEVPLATLLNSLSKGENVTDIAGLWINFSGTWHKNPIGHLLEDLDSLPFPDRSLFFKYPFLKNMSLKRLITEIGCPYPCTFCHAPLYKQEMLGKGRLHRQKSPQYVIGEIESIQGIAPLNSIHFSDDTFGHDLKWLKEFANIYKDTIKLPFTCNARADTNMEAIGLLKSAGCVGVQIGLESGSKRIREELLKKYWTQEQAVEVCRAFKKVGIKLMATNMIGLPSETLEEALSTIQLNATCGVDFARCNVFLPHPALQLTKWAQENGYIDKNYSIDDFDAAPLNPIVKTPHREQFINIANLFSLSVKKGLMKGPFGKLLLNSKPNNLYNFIGSLNLMQEFRFFNLKLLPALDYFRNTIGNPLGFKYGAWPTDRVGKK